MSVFLEWIQKLHAAAGEMPHVASNANQLMLERSRSQQTICGRDRLVWRKAAPANGDAGGDRQNAIRELTLCLLQPPLKVTGLLGVTKGFARNPRTDFSQGDHADSEIFGRLGIKPAPHRHGASFPSAEFRKDIVVQQKAHQSSRLIGGRSGRFIRGSFRSNIHWSSSASSGAESRCSLKLSAFLVPSSASCKMRRCSSSAETPCSTARRFSFLTKASGMFRTSNWAIPKDASIASNGQGRSR